MSKAEEKEKQQFPAQTQDVNPGNEAEMSPRPEVIAAGYKGSGKLKDKVALITGGDSGIGRAVAVAFAKEGADVSIVYLEQHDDAKETKTMVENEGRKCLLLAGDIQDEEFCKHAIEQTTKELKKLNVLVNNAGVQYFAEKLEDITAAQLEKTFRTNIFSMFYMAKHALKHMQKGDTIINTTSVTAYKGNPHLIDYSSTKGAIVTFTRSLASSLCDRGIRVNGVAPGPIWTPFIPASFPAEYVKTFGSQVPFKRAGQPNEVAPCFVFLASNDSSYMSGQIMHPNGGEIVGS